MAGTAPPGPDWEQPRKRGGIQSGYREESSGIAMGLAKAPRPAKAKFPGAIAGRPSDMAMADHKAFGAATAVKDRSREWALLSCLSTVGALEAKFTRHSEARGLQS